MRQTRAQDKAASAPSPPVYQFDPPAWLPKSSGSADLGFHGYHPPRPKFDEDLLTESSVKSGYVLQPAVSAETFSAQVFVNENLQSKDTLNKLSELVNEVFKRKHEDSALISAHSYRMPMRVTLNDAKKQAWFNDLANPDIPLHKLGKNVPHGAKGHDLLELLHTIGVTVPRAVWFLRVSGANETSGLRNKPSYNPLQYSTDWANIFLGFVKKQLSEIALPSAPRAGLNIKSSFKGMLSDPEARLRWVARFTYSLKLLKAFYDEGLLDRRTFYTWLVQQIDSCNIAQTSFVIRLVYEYFDGMAPSRPLCKPLAEACLGKLSEISTTCPEDVLTDTRALLKVVLQRMSLALPDALVSPPVWNKHSQLMLSISGEPSPGSSDKSVPVSRTSYHRSVARSFEEVKARNEALLFHPAKQPACPEITLLITDVQLLNSISHQTDMESIRYFPKGDLHDLPQFDVKLDRLLTWSVTPLQYGDHRPFVALTLLKHFRNQAGERANRRDVQAPDQFLQDALFQWLDTSEAAGDINNLRWVTLLYGKLVKYEIFSYPSYIQRLIARGEPGLSSADEHAESRHRRYLRWIPLYSATPDLQSQRKLILYGVRAREIPEDRAEKEIRGEIRALLPELFGGPVPADELDIDQVFEHSQLLATATRYEQVRIFRQWLGPILQSRLESHAREPTSSCLRSYCIVVELMAHTKCYRALLDLTVCVLENNPANELLYAALDTIHRFITILACGDVVPLIIRSLYRAHLASRTGIKSRPLMMLLVNLDAGRYLHSAERDQLFRDTTDFTLSLQLEHQAESMPANLPEVLWLATNLSADAPSTLATSLWLKYRSSPEWAWKVWDDTFASLRQLPSMFPDPVERQATAMRYGSFLHEIDKRLPTGLNPHVLMWLQGAGQAEVVSLGTDVWDILIPVLLDLIVHGTIQSMTILQGIVYPAWKLASSVKSLEDSDASMPLQDAAMRFSDALLLTEAKIFRGVGLSTRLVDMQRLHTQRKLVFREPYFPSLSAALLTLVWIECNEHFGESFKSQVRALRLCLCSDRSLSRGAYLHLEKMKTLYEGELSRAAGEDGSGNVSRNIIATFGLIFNISLFDSSNPNIMDMTSFECPWKVSASNVLFQLLLHNASQALSLSPTHVPTLETLVKLVARIWQDHPTVIPFFARYIRDAHPTIVQKCLASGTEAILKLVRSLNPGSDGYPDLQRRTSDFLHLLVYLASSHGHSFPSVTMDATVLEPLLLEIRTNLVNASSLLVTVDASFVGILVRLLHFVLGFRVAWPLEALKPLNSTLLSLAVRLSELDSPDLSLVSMVFDTLYYVLDSIPPGKPPFDPFRLYLDIPLSKLLSAKVPKQVQQRVQALLQASFTTDSVANLVVARKDGPSGEMRIDGPVVNRPWEWTENLGEPPPTIALRDRPTAKLVLPNTSSISLQTFDAHPTGEFLLEEPGIGNIYPGPVSSFFDGVSSNDLFKQDWQESRLQNDRLIEPVSRSRISPGVSGGNSPTKGRAQTSPIRNTGGRSYPPSSSGSRLGSSSSDAIDVDVFSSGGKRATQKRKAVSDDEVEIVAAGPSTQHRPAVKKARAKKR